MARETLGEDVFGRCKDGVDITEGVGVLVDDVAAVLRPQRFTPRTERGGDRADRAKQSVFDVDVLQRILGLCQRRRNHQGDGVADHPHPIRSERPEHRRVEAGQHGEVHERIRLRLHLLTGVHGHHARRTTRLRDVDADDLGVRMRTPQERGVDHAVDDNVGDVGALADQEPPVFLAGDTRPDELADERRSHFAAPFESMSGPRASVMAASMLSRIEA